MLLSKLWRYTTFNKGFRKTILYQTKGEKSENVVLPRTDVTISIRYWGIGIGIGIGMGMGIGMVFSQGNQISIF